MGLHRIGTTAGQLDSMYIYLLNRQSSKIHYSSAKDVRTDEVGDSGGNTELLGKNECNGTGA